MQTELFYNNRIIFGYITNNVLSFHEEICMNKFVVCSKILQHMGLKALRMHLLHKILRIPSPPWSLSTNPNQGPSSWLLSPSMVYFVIAICRGWDKRLLCVLMGHNNLGRDNLWDLKVHLGVQEFMSLLLLSFHVVVWSCMADVVLHNVLWCQFLEDTFHKLAFMWGRLQCTNKIGFISRDASFLFRHHKNLFGCRKGKILFIMMNLVYTLRTRPRSATISPYIWPGPKVIDNITTSCYLYIEKLIHAPNVPPYLGNYIIGGQPPIPSY